MISKRLLNHLDKRGIAYAVVPHRKVFTAFDLAQTLDADPKHVAKTVLVRADRDLVLVSVPAHSRLDFARMKKVLGAKQVTLASERAMEQLKIKEGTTPPFASFFKIACVLDSGLAKCKTMLCRSGSHTESLDCSVANYIASEEPTIAKVSERAKRAPAKRRAPVKAKRAPAKAKRTTAKRPTKRKAVRRKPAARKRS
ncbi:MAG: YbaK/EbsC family protein [bacterium]|nr:YbaK/EbsC family protein [bacterium]